MSDPHLTRTGRGRWGRWLALSGYHGIRGALWCRLAPALAHACEHYEFETLLLIDTDALLIAAGLEQEAAALFGARHEVGMLGSYKIDCNGSKRAFVAVGRRMQREYGFYGFAQPLRGKLLRRWICQAKQHAYTAGEHVLGGRRPPRVDEPPRPPVVSARRMLRTEGQDGFRHFLDRRVRADGCRDQTEPRFVRVPAAKFHQHADRRFDLRPRIESLV